MFKHTEYLLENNLNLQINKYSILKNICIQYIGNDKSSYKQFLDIIEKYIDTIYFSNNDKQSIIDYHKYKPDVVVCDTNKTDLSAFEISTQIKQQNPDQPIIITSAYTNTENLIEAIKIGIDAYIIKPINTLLYP